MEAATPEGNARPTETIHATEPHHSHTPGVRIRRMQNGSSPAIGTLMQNKSGINVNTQVRSRHPNLELVDLKKTDGQMAEANGVKVYTLFYEVRRR